MIGPNGIWLGNWAAPRGLISKIGPRWLPNISCAQAFYSARIYNASVGRSSRREGWLLSNPVGDSLVTYQDNDRFNVMHMSGNL